MPTPDEFTPTTSVALSGFNAVDALLFNSKWSVNSLTFSFPNIYSYWSEDTLTGYGPSAGINEPWSTRVSPLAPSDQTATRLALKNWSSVANISFTEVTESATNVGVLRFYYTSNTDSGLTGQAWAYNPTNAAFAGDVWFAVEGGTSSSFYNEWSLGSYFFETVVHEIGHALGLKHPFDPSPSNTQTLQPYLDSRSFTVMSYSAKPGDQTTHFSYEPTTPMVLDIQSIQYLYGPNTSYQSGNTTWSFSGSRTYHQTIWDAGGKDTIVYTATTGGIIDLRAGIDYGSGLGAPVYVQNSSGANLYEVKNIWIAYGVTIENAAGGSGADLLQGNEVANILKGSAGNDTLIGSGGNDFLSGGVGFDSLDGGIGVDTVDFSDKTGVVSLALNGGIAVTVTVAGIAEDSIKSIENIIGGSAADTLSGDGLANSLVGNAGKDTLKGLGGGDVLAGGLGSDVLTGGAGNDRFVFNRALGITNIDKITDFTVGADKIVLDDDIFTALGITGTTAGIALSNLAVFQLGSAANDASDRIIYEQSSGKLYYDADGSGSGSGAQVQIAVLGASSHPSLAATDFLIVA